MRKDTELDILHPLSHFNLVYLSSVQEALFTLYLFYNEVNGNLENQTLPRMFSSTFSIFPFLHFLPIILTYFSSSFFFNENEDSQGYGITLYFFKLLPVVISKNGLILFQLLFYFSIILHLQKETLIYNTRNYFSNWITALIV